MGDFKVGDRVRCINPPQWARRWPNHPLCDPARVFTVKVVNIPGSIGPEIRLDSGDWLYAERAELVPETTYSPTPVKPQPTKVYPKCPTCHRETTPELDAYYGASPLYVNLKTWCSRCRDEWIRLHPGALNAAPG